MKKIFVTILITAAFIFSSNSFAQFGFKIGPKAGINLANLSFDPDLQSGVDKSSRLGFKFGAAAELGFSPMFAVQIEPMYAQKGAELEFDAQDPNTGQVIKGTQDLKLAFIEIPILFKVKFSAGSITPYVFAGPNIGILLSSDIEQEIAGQTAEADIKDQTSSIDFVIDFGAGIGFAVGPGVALTFDARYALGLTDLNDDPQAGNQTIKSSGIQILVGAMFGL
jgi:hypothetical protein